MKAIKRRRGEAGRAGRAAKDEREEEEQGKHFIHPNSRSPAPGGKTLVMLRLLHFEKNL